MATRTKKRREPSERPTPPFPKQKLLAFVMACIFGKGVWGLGGCLLYHFLTTF